MHPTQEQIDSVKKIRQLELDAFTAVAKACRANETLLYERLSILPTMAKLFKIDGDTFRKTLDSVAGEEGLKELASFSKFYETASGPTIEPVMAPISSHRPTKRRSTITSTPPQPVTPVRPHPHHVTTSTIASIATPTKSTPKPPKTDKDTKTQIPTSALGVLLCDDTVFIDRATKKKHVDLGKQVVSFMDLPIDKLQETYSVQDLMEFRGKLLRELFTLHDRYAQLTL
ncbi:hypothetical protein ADUPG1_008064 [Aduncisulcus paluster]|uniref:ENT domain-containing protein n=1 Tax=Aduncisulcus paluster TaxID=2918883 RepID=A0ABQ5KQN8_9EUKA|nr:hypothetical protein ADUPG1_008064 [Aduncisulcus paluster]|eukprot:gnl/Carplike_NY0171/2081_a2799_570.p1 GENE.gnl/Carplike_NY0171/2081_a2799_570~~gnl/Carplike_NY0171/2081_a2799_570.p1  ORF type:complete len:243 (+),score=34.07 gnl/Carplike_NY0171/2081_a2799_570:45-731(+)